MVRRQSHLIGAVLAAVVLALGVTAVPAQATPNGLYDCQSVTYIPFLVNRPVIGGNCVGPLGTAPPGSVYEIPTDQYYSCQHLTGTVMPDGTLWAHGSICDPF